MVNSLTYRNGKGSIHNNPCTIDIAKYVPESTNKGFYSI